MKIERINKYSQEELTAFLVASFSEGNNFAKKFIENLDEFFEYRWSENEGIFIAKQNNSIVGVIQLLIDPLFVDSKSAVLKHLYVLPKYRNQGIATSLITTAIHHARPHFNSLSINNKDFSTSNILIKLGFEHFSEDPVDVQRLIIYAQTHN